MTYKKAFVNIQKQLSLCRLIQRPAIVLNKFKGQTVYKSFTIRSVYLSNYKFLEKHLSLH